MPAVEPASSNLGREVLKIIFGPWPLRPALALIVGFVFNLYARNEAFDANTANVVDRYRSVVPIAFVIAVSPAVVLWIWRAMRERFPGTSSRTGYLAGLLLAGAALGSVAFVLRPDFDFSDPHFQGILFYGARGLVFLMFIHTIAGINDARLRAQIARTESALDDVREQRQAVLEAEERTRTSVARFLHDQVQAGLVAISLQLQAITQRASDPIQDELGSIVEELEEIRSIDVRAASRRLSPDIATTGLTSAIQGLLSGYSDSIEVRLSVNDALAAWTPSSDVEERVALAVYRVVEQALLNAAVHGRPQQVVVLLGMDAQTITLRVEDDGAGLPADGTTPGSGSRIISTWLAILDGSWSLASGPNGGAVLSATFPLRGRAPSHS